MRMLVSWMPLAPAVAATHPNRPLWAEDETVLIELADPSGPLAFGGVVRF
jgi:hypothetical protein